MVLKRLFGSGKSDPPELDPLQDLVLRKLRVGYLVDYDLQTWQVTDHCRYDFGDGEEVEEWELVAGGEKRFLEHSSEDDSWSFARKISLGDIEGDVRAHILEHEDPPDTLVYEGREYRLDVASAGYMHEDDSGEGEPLIRWEFSDEDDERFVSIEQWGETEFEATAGLCVEEYQFANILPGAQAGSTE